MKLLQENKNFKEEKSKIKNGYKISNHVMPFSFELISNQIIMKLILIESINTTKKKYKAN